MPAYKAHYLQLCTCNFLYMVTSPFSVWFMLWLRYIINTFSCFFSKDLILLPNSIEVYHISISICLRLVQCVAFVSHSTVSFDWCANVNQMWATGSVNIQINNLQNDTSTIQVTYESFHKTTNYWPIRSNCK